MSIAEQLMSIINNTEMPEELKRIWENAHKYLSPQEYIFLTQAIGSFDDGEIKEISYVLKQKIESFEANNRLLINKIIDQERRVI